jgi:hypothetical protein
MINIKTDARNGKIVNDPLPTTQLKTNHPNATAEMEETTPTMKPAIVERNWTDAQMSAKDIGTPTTSPASLDAKNDKGMTKIYASRVRILYP